MESGCSIFLDASFHFEIFVERGVQCFADAFFHIRKVPETGSHEVLHACSQTLMNSETGVHMITRRRFPNRPTFWKRRPHWNPKSLSTLLYILEQGSGFNADADFQMNPDMETGGHMKVAGIHIKLDAGFQMHPDEETGFHIKLDAGIQFI